jgi:hypothetical protein
MVTVYRYPIGNISVDSKWMYEISDAATKEIKYIGTEVFSNDYSALIDALIEVKKLLCNGYS